MSSSGIWTLFLPWWCAKHQYAGKYSTSAYILLKASCVLKNSTKSQRLFIIKTALWLVSNVKLVAELCPFYCFWVSGNTVCTIGIENTTVCTKEWQVYTRVHIMLFQSDGDGPTTISWPRSWRRRVCSHSPACLGDHIIRGCNAKAAAGASHAGLSH